jgi:hypothetical protein
MPNTSPLKRRLAMIQITKSGKGSKINRVPIHAIDKAIDTMNTSFILDSQIRSEYATHSRRSKELHRLPAMEELF